MKTQLNKMYYPNLIIVVILFLGLLAFGQQAIAGDSKDLFTSKNDEIQNLHTFNSLTRPFVIKVRNRSAGKTGKFSFEIPTKGSGYNYLVDCDSDGLLEARGITGDYVCNYQTLNDHTISIYGDFPQIDFSGANYRYSKDSNKLLSIEQWGANQWRSMEGAFSDCGNLIYNANDQPNLSLVTDMSDMFARASLFNGRIGSWNTSNVTDMNHMFRSAKLFNQDIGNWDTSNVTDMNSMFFNAEKFNKDIGNWNTSNVIDMSHMFAYTKAFNQDIGNWDVSNVSNMSNMFFFTESFNQDIGRWDVGSVINMRGMFLDSFVFNQDIGNWNVSNVELMIMMFAFSAFDQDIGNWDMSNVYFMPRMFLGSKLSMGNYDKLLNGWSQLNLHPNNFLDVGDTQYSSASSAARAKIISDFGWTISDGGYAWWLDYNFNYPFYP